MTNNHSTATSKLPRKAVNTFNNLQHKHIICFQPGLNTFLKMFLLQMYLMRRKALKDANAYFSKERMSFDIHSLSCIASLRWNIIQKY